MNLIKMLCVIFGVFLANPSWADEGSSDVEPAPAPRDRPDWSRDPYVSPRLNYGRYRSGDTAYGHLVLGVEGGLHYRQKKLGPKLKGTTRALAAILVGSGVQGREVRVGSFIGPWVGPVGLSVGPDVFTQQASYGSVVLDPVVGLAMPVVLTADIKVVRAYAGVIPGWYLSGDRPGVQSDGFLGVGDEQAFVAGVNLRLVVAHLGVSYYVNEDAFGMRQQVGFSVGLGM